MIKLFVSQFDDKLSLVFNLFDFNKDGFISKEEVKTVLQYLPIFQDSDFKTHQIDQDMNITFN